MPSSSLPAMTDAVSPNSVSFAGANASSLAQSAKA
jgi:hypothetical protein